LGSFCQNLQDRSSQIHQRKDSLSLAFVRQAQALALTYHQSRIMGLYSYHAGSFSRRLFRRTIETIVCETSYDPVIEHLSEGQPLLAIWLSQSVACDPSRRKELILGGMVKRARRPRIET
jgi:hypothetical protein